MRGSTSLLQTLHKAERILRTAYRGLLAQTAGPLPPAAVWLVDNYTLLYSVAREVRESFPKSFYRKLPAAGAAPKIYTIAVELAEKAGADLSAARLKRLLENDPQITALTLAELWALGPMLNFVLLEQVCQIAAAGDFSTARAESTLRRSVNALRAMENTPWRELVEAVSPVELTLRQDPAGVYARMAFRTRDECRHSVETIARGSHLSEREVAAIAVRLARTEHRSVSWSLLGPGLQKLRRRTSSRPGLKIPLRSVAYAFPSTLYLGGIALLTAAVIWIAVRLLGPLPWWYLALLALPASQAAVTVMNSLVSLCLPPRRLPRMDFSEGVPDDCRSFVVVPTLLLSRNEVEKLLERLEIHYLANRDPNILFALLTDFPDSQAPQGDQRVLDACVEGVRRLNQRHRNGNAPFFLFHRGLEWNPQQSVWMGRERKRGKLNDFNALLLDEYDAFPVKVGDLSLLSGVRYVITLDSDTQLPLDTARELIAAMAHPLNHPVFDEETNVVREGYALMQPRVSISMESSGRSLLARIYSGQTGFDPYTTAVSDMYQDLYGRATFTGKGIYDVRAFHRAAGNRFPDNTLLSHDLIEGEHSRVGLLTDLEVLDDYPSTYESYSKRKHRWVRGDWQIASWIYKPGPLDLLSRWKIVDNLRRSLLELALAGMLLSGSSSLLVVALVALPAWSDLLFGLLRLPPPRFWSIYLRELLYQFGRSHLDALLTLAFLPYQACLMADAVGRTLVRRCITHRRLLEWQTMAQSEAGGTRGYDLTRLYMYVCPLLAIPITLLCKLPIALVELWVAAPLLAVWLNSFPGRFRPSRSADPEFLRAVALRTWRYFTDFALAESHWLAPDNVQEDPPARAHRTSPTNLGMQLAAHITAHDFGYVTHQELAMRLDQILCSIRRLERHRGHFYNWYDTRTLEPVTPLYISTVDSGNLAASLIALKQGCAGMAERPLIARNTLLSMRDHCRCFRDALPAHAHTGSIILLLQSLMEQLESDPTDLFYWEAVLTEVRAIVNRLREPVERLCPRYQEACYWFHGLESRIEIALNDLYALAPWLGPQSEAELRICSRQLPELIVELCRIPTLKELPEHHAAIAAAIRQRLQKGPALPATTERVLEHLLTELESARQNATRLLEDFRQQAALAALWVEEMDFTFLFDRRRKLLHLGYNVAAEKLDGAYYDLLGSEARTAVFVAIAKGEIPREAWFRLGRRLTSYRGQRSLVSWSGTMFEYLMPELFLKTHPGTLLGQTMQAVIAIQQRFARERGVPWGISEAGNCRRDHELNYQYCAFGIPALAANPKLATDLVVAPYATLLGTMVDSSAAAENLERMAANGWMSRYGFYESADYSNGHGALEIVRSHMVHHQGMGLIALSNALLDGVMQQRFHADPMVLATEYLLQERVPSLIEVTPELTVREAPLTLTLRPTAEAKDAAGVSARVGVRKKA
jgi:hypothetical protein